MDTTERRMWEKIRERWDGFCVRVEASRGGVDPGTPDCLLMVRGRGGVWVELKVWPTPLEAIQLAWAIDCAQRGGTALVMCQVGRREFWVGTAEEYDMFESKPAGVSLQAALAMIGLAVSG